MKKATSRKTLATIQSIVDAICSHASPSSNQYEDLCDVTRKNDGYYFQIREVQGEIHFYLCRSADDPTYVCAEWLLGVQGQDIDSVWASPKCWPFDAEKMLLYLKKFVGSYIDELYDIAAKEKQSADHLRVGYGQWFPKK